MSTRGVATEFIELEVGKWITLPTNAVNIVFESAGSAVIKTAHTTSSIEHTVGTVSSNSLVVKDDMFILQKVKTTVASARIYFGRSK